MIVRTAAGVREMCPMCGGMFANLRALREHQLRSHHARRAEVSVPDPGARTSEGAEVPGDRGTDRGVAPQAPAGAGAAGKPART